MPTFVVILLAMLASARIWKLLAKDEITWFARKHLVYRFDDEHWIRRGIDCPYCLGFWINAAVIPIAYFWHPTPVLILLAVLAGSEITGKLEG